MSASLLDETAINDAPVLPFPGTRQASIEQAGGKGQSLIRLASAGFSVPPGVVLASDFFDSWFDAMLSAPEWAALQSAPPELRPAMCDALKRQAIELPLNRFQQNVLAQLQLHLVAENGDLFAVRSSSPQEDLDGASFAGGYETRLGVRRADLLDAIRTCFASVFDERVVAYKTARGMSLAAPRMAVVIQAQLDSEVAGVAFSLNPLNNDYDQAVIDAAWGQGETVVAGLVTPDHWVLDRQTSAVLEARIADKRLSRWLQTNGGLLDRHDHRRAEPCLAPDQLRQLLNVINRAEELFGEPVDIEWAFAGGTLYVLQARPVTAFVPLPPALVTAPGERRRLYLDIALSTGLTINAPISPMGLDVFRRLASDLVRLAFGGTGALPAGEDALVVLDGGRMYFELSNALWLGGPRVMAAKLRMGDALVARVIESLDAGEYKSLRRPDWARLRYLWRVPVAWWRLRRLLANFFLPFVVPQRMHRRIAQHLAAGQRELAANTDLSLPLDVFWDRYVTKALRTLFEVSMAGVGAGVMAVKAFSFLARRIVDKDAALRDRLDRGFAGNVVVAMSIEMQRLATLLPRDPLVEARELERQLVAGELPPAFQEGWDDFVRRYGDRGPLEMDVAHPRYGDAPQLALAQIAAMPVDAAAPDLAAAARRQIDARRAATAAVIAQAGPLRRVLLRRLDTIVELFAGMRDTPKHDLLAALHALRRRLVLEGERLHRDGRLDAAEHVFDLRMDELVAAAADPTLDLRGLRVTRRGYYDRLATQVTNFPSLIDSRGRILRAPPGPRRDGEFAGVGLSPGIVSGPARTLRSPHEKPLAKGEILIAYTTDPGWTPIFTNAAAVVLEIGGTLQHGAVVARELGLPCVAGIEGITVAIADGEWIEVDGHRGTLRRLPADDCGANPIG